MNCKKNLILKRLILITGIFAIFQILLNIALYSNEELEMVKYLQRSLSPFDENLLKIINKKYLYPPSTKPYNLKILKKGIIKDNFIFNRKGDVTWNAIYEMIKTLYPNRSKPGFFVEAGAYDGEYLSNTLYLELELGWNGLLVEPSSSNTKKVLDKNRKAWFCPCCLATKPHPHRTFLQILVNENDEFHDTMNSVVGTKNIDDRTSYGNPIFEEVQCLPLHSILSAINQRHVDLISLDIEDAEDLVLENFSWDKIDVDIWIVEHRHPDTKFLTSLDKIDPNFVNWFEDKGYVLYDVSVYFLSNYAFVKKNSSYYTKNKERLKLE